MGKQQRALIPRPLLPTIREKGSTKAVVMAEGSNEGENVG